MPYRTCRQASPTSFTVLVYESEVIQRCDGLRKLQVMAMVGCESVCGSELSWQWCAGGGGGACGTGELGKVRVR